MNNELTEFNTGGTHSQNELGGIPQGMGSNGQINTVEEGETKKDSFIYSNRITLTPQVIAQFNLPKSLSGKTAADATKLINNKFEGRNSKIDNNTKKAFLDRIAEAQESIKAIEQAKIAESIQSNSTEVPDMMEGQIPQGMEEFTQPMAYGGNLQNKMNFGGFFQGQQGQNNMGMIGNMAGNMGNSMNTYGQQMNQSKLPEGYVDEKAIQDAQGNQMIDSTKDTVASATGPIGQMFRGIQKAGQGIGNSIGGEGGAAVSGIFSPEEGTMSAMKDKDLSIGQKALATIPGVGGVIAKRQADKRLNKWMFEKDTFESNSKISNFAFGGLLGEPGLGEPTSKNSKVVEKLKPQQVINNVNTMVNPNLETEVATSRLKGNIVSIEEGISGKYVYYKPKSTPGFNPETDRDYVLNKNWETVRGTDEYLNYLRNRTKSFAKGGNMYNDGGDLTDPTKPWMLPKSTMADDPNLSGYGPAGFRKTFDGIPHSKELPLDQQIDIKSTYNPKTFYKQSFNQMRKPLISNEIGFKSKLNYNDPDVITLSPEQLKETGGYSNPELAPENVKPGYVSPYPKAKLGETLNKAGKYVKDNFGNALRYAPVAMNAYQLAKMGKPEVETLDRLGNKYNPQYMDERALTNQINAETNYTANALANASNGSLGSLSNNILGMQLNKTKALSDAYSKIADVNRNENKTGQQFNLGVDQANIGQSNMEKDINAANRAAYRREKSKLLGNIGEDLGNIGKETVYKKLAGEAFGYSYDGKYLLKPDGTKVSEEELDSTIKTNLSSVGATEKEGKYFDTTGKEISKEEVLKMIGTQKTFNKNYQGKFSSMNTNFGNISLTNNNKQ